MNDERAYGIAAPIAAKWPVSTSAMWIAMVRAGYLAALEDAAKACEAERDRLLSLQSGREGDGADVHLRITATAGCGVCAAAVRALGE